MIKAWWMVPIRLAGVIALASGAHGTADVAKPLTRPEATGFRETSSYDDVIRFLADLKQQGAPIEISYIGTSPQGRRIPLVIMADPMVTSPRQAKRAGKPIVYIQANIHGGEVEGKEATQMLLRDLSGSLAIGNLSTEASERWNLSRTKPNGPIRQKLILLVAPIYNIDGNEKLGDVRRNRPQQNGPSVVGERANGQGLDLNRDSMKAETPEMQAALRRIYREWDPHVMIDLHTTNGTTHGYHLTYSPPLNPNTDAEILGFTRDAFLPNVRELMERRYNLSIFEYGNVEMHNSQQGWYTFGEEPRYLTNYVGLRNRIAILSEAASFLPFHTRIEATYRFVETILEEVGRNGHRLRSVTRHADNRASRRDRGQETKVFGVRFAFESRGPEAILLQKRGSPRTPGSMAPAELEPVNLPVFDRFRATRTARLPAGYLIPQRLKSVVELLRRHGARIDRLRRPWSGTIEEFNIREMNAAATAFQGHRLVRLEGSFTAANRPYLRGDFLVRTGQPLGRLIFHLLEPESLDGVAAWGFLEGALAAYQPYPIGKVFDLSGMRTERS